jgi:hypothetical protein
LNISFFLALAPPKVSEPALQPSFDDDGDLLGFDDDNDDPGLLPSSSSSSSSSQPALISCRF